MIKDWEGLFGPIREKEYAHRLRLFLDEEYAKGVVYPPHNLVFRAFALTKPSEVKVVILGQDPYHNPGQAMGLSFSVPRGEALPPSLVNVYSEIEKDLGVAMNYHNGDLTPWANQGVLLLNAYLTVRKNEPLSHEIPEYEALLNDVLDYLDGLNQPMVFLLWGSFARRAVAHIHNPNHLILTSAHPSPLSAYRGWFGNHHFSRANAFLESHGVKPIDWRIS